MPYSEKTKAIIANAPKTLGTDLARWAMLRDISVKRIAMATGATRQTVYNWFTGSTEVTSAYKDRVTTIIDTLKKVSQTDDAWRTLCTQFNLRKLTDEEFFRTCLQILVMGELPKNYQEELLKRYEKALDKLAEPAR
jgi:plasmid maintenance system antidote protein VapI